MNFQKILCILSFLLTSCDKTIENKYLSSKITDSSIQDIIKPDVKEGFKKVCHSSVERAEIIPRSLKQEVSLVLNENLSVKSALCEIAKRLNINFQMEPDIDAKIIFHANRKSFIEILDTVCDMADLRLTITADGFVKIVKDTPYIMTYNVQFLNFARDSENKISIATEISSTPTVGIDKHSTQSPESMMAIRTKSDFWEELSENIRTILINQSKDNVKYSINRQSGVITVYANSKIHRSVREYLRKVESAISS
ncbi:MAG: hypothetical protein LBF70_01390, partial [Holosporales bacterium]|nr:hypothetical protein [Holosporales bacterium]